MGAEEIQRTDPVLVRGYQVLENTHTTELSIQLDNICLNLTLECSSCSNTGSIRDDPYWTSRKNSLELIKLSRINKVSLV